jgi:hypothetical protein
MVWGSAATVKGKPPTDDRYRMCRAYDAAHPPKVPDRHRVKHCAGAGMYAH